MLRRFDLVDTPRVAFVPPKAEENRIYIEAAPRALDGTRLPLDNTRRRVLAAWMTDPKNPWFAKAIVNRMWAHFMGRGFTEPIDDFRPSNPPVLPGLLEALVGDFMQHGCDLQRLIRTICLSRAYQLESAGVKGEGGEALWSSHRLKPMAPEVLLDALVDATDLKPVLERVAGERLDRMKQGLLRQFVFLFDVDEDREQEDFQGTLPQALLLLNGRLTNDGTRPIPGAALQQALQLQGDGARIEALYLRAYGRLPRAEEQARWTAFLNAERTAAPAMAPPADPKGPAARLDRQAAKAPGNPKAQALGDVFWCLLNSSEFSFNH
jgi:hypothetical protein